MAEPGRPDGAPPRVLLDARRLRERVAELGRAIAADHPDGVVLVGVLKGALIFFADLVRAVPDVPVTVDFMSISRFAADSGRVRILHDLQSDIAGRDVVVVEDIVDTGLTLAYLIGQLQAREPRRLAACALLDRPERRIVPQEVRYRGEEIAGDVFVLGYGLHHRDLYRNLPFVVTADREAVARAPDVYVRSVYGRGGGAGDGSGSGSGW